MDFDDDEYGFEEGPETMEARRSLPESPMLTQKFPIEADHVAQHELGGDPNFEDAALHQRAEEQQLEQEQEQELQHEHEHEHEHAAAPSEPGLQPTSGATDELPAPSAEAFWPSRDPELDADGFECSFPLPERTSPVPPESQGSSTGFEQHRPPRAAEAFEGLEQDPPRASGTFEGSSGADLHEGIFQPNIQDDRQAVVEEDGDEDRASHVTGGRLDVGARDSCTERSSPATTRVNSVAMVAPGDGSPSAPTDQLVPSIPRITRRQSFMAVEMPLIVEVEYHAAVGSFHTKYDVRTYKELADKFRELLEQKLEEARIRSEIKLNPGPPKGFDSYYNIAGWYQHSRSAQARERSRWSQKPAKKLQYPRLGAFEIIVKPPRSPEASSAWRGLPRSFEVFSKLKLKRMPQVKELAEWLAAHMIRCRDGVEGAAQELLAVTKAARLNTTAAIVPASNALVLANPEGTGGPKLEGALVPYEPLPLGDPAAFRRPERNPPMWMSLHPRGSPPEPTVPGRGRPGSACASKLAATPMLTARAARVPLDMVEKVRTRMKAAAYSLGGRSWAELFRRQDKDGSGRLDWFEFRQMCRRVLKLMGEDVHLMAIFQVINTDNSGEISVEELVAFITDPLQRMRQRLKSAAKERCPDGWERFFKEQLNATLDYSEFRCMCRMLLRLNEAEVQLRAVFSHLDASNGEGEEICIEDLINFLNEPSPLINIQAPTAREAFHDDHDDDGDVEVSRQTDMYSGMQDRSGLLERTRSRMKGAAYGLCGEAWPRYFRDQITAMPGQLDYREFINLCQYGLRLSDDPEHFRLVFLHLDHEGVGLASVEDVVDFVAPAPVCVESCMELLGQATWCQKPRCQSAR